MGFGNIKSDLEHRIKSDLIQETAKRIAPLMSELEKGRHSVSYIATIINGIGNVELNFSEGTPTELQVRICKLAQQI